MKVHQKSRQSATWVVYQSAVKGEAIGPNAVCEQGEWEAMEAAAPGRNRLIRSGIVNEGEAERLARGTSGDPVPRVSKAK
jgi:hypothetical protein